MTMHRAAFLLLGLISMSAPLRAADGPEGLPSGYRLLYEQNFQDPSALKDFAFSDPAAWRFAADGQAGALELAGKSRYQPAHRSPLNIALIADRVFGDFILEAEVQSTVKPYGHQDMCLFYGFAGTNRFYYTHLAVAADPHAHNIFIVTNAPRLAIARETTKGVTWGEGQWHKIRLERKTIDGTIQVFFDDLSRPIMRAEEKTITRGAIGFGSFDDKGKVRRVRIWGPAMSEQKSEFFQRPKP